MKNITLSVDEEVLRVVRVYASQRNSSVNQLVRQFLQGISDQENRAAKARRRLRKMSEQSEARIGTRNWSREDIYDR